MASPPPGPGAEPGLRQRKKAETRQRISDVATMMFLENGYDAVRVADIAEQVGVSEKTIFNYFPTKESLILDQADEQLERVITALSERPSGLTPTRAFVSEISRQFTEMLQEDDFERTKAVVPRFGALMEETPALNAAWGEHRHRLVIAISEVLADDLGVDPLDPEPRTAARALVSLTELAYESMARNIERAQSGAELQALIEADLNRGVRLLDTGLWSLALMISARRHSAAQLREASAVAERAGRQVLSAIREARRGWREANRARELSDDGQRTTGRGQLRGRGRA